MRRGEGEGGGEAEEEAEGAAAYCFLRLWGPWEKGIVEPGEREHREEDTEPPG